MKERWVICAGCGVRWRLGEQRVGTRHQHPVCTGTLVEALDGRLVHWKRNGEAGHYLAEIERDRGTKLSARFLRSPSGLWLERQRLVFGGRQRVLRVLEEVAERREREARAVAMKERRDAERARMRAFAESRRPS